MKNVEAVQIVQIVFCYCYIEELPEKAGGSFQFMQEFARKFYKTQAWKKTRAAIWSRDRGLCVDCLKRGLLTPAEEVHHVEPLTPENISDPSVTLNPANLVSLCRECHKARHDPDDGPRRYDVDELGRISPRFKN